MLDLEMLSRLARPAGGVIIGPQPPRLHEVFARVVADGWAPRTPARRSELVGLEASRCRGDCISPLIVDGDLAFIDPATPALPGDLVQFKLSERGAAAQNSALPPGQSPWSAGSMWLKLLTRYRGLDMVLDRHGHSATATLLSCESPDDTPILHPVRNIVRRGRLLYPPNSYSAEIAANAATFVAQSSVSNVSLTGTGAAIVSQAVGPFSAAVTVVVTVSGYLTATYTTSGLTWVPEMAYAINTTSGSLPAGHPYYNPTPVPGVNTYGSNFVYESTFSLAAGATATYYFNAACTTLVSGASMAVAQMVLKTEAVVR